MRTEKHILRGAALWAALLFLTLCAWTGTGASIGEPERTLSGKALLNPSPDPSREQTADIVPDSALLRAPFSVMDEVRFQSPEKVFYPETWFHFIGGNVSREGIDADLQAIADAGISGIQWFHGHFGGPWPATERQVRALTPEWEELVAHLARKADSLGLRLSIQTCPGWAMAGGPWITPENAMRHLAWSRTDVEGGGLRTLRLPLGDPSSEEWRDWRDICVLAFPTPLGDTGEPLHPVDVHAEDEAWQAMAEGSGKAVHLPAGGTHILHFSLQPGEVIRTVQLPSAGDICYNFVYDPAFHVTLTAQTAGGDRTLVDADLPMAAWQHAGGDIYLACNEVHDAAQYTLTIRNGHPSTLGFVRFLSAARKNNWRGEAGWALIAKEEAQEHTEQDPRAFVRSAEILDLSPMMAEDGTLDWEAPEGRWTVLRIGHVNTGRRNGPAPPEATGWECNKLSPQGAQIQFDHYVGALQDGPLAGRAGGMLMDSWECQTQTWTGTMEADFAELAHYPLRAWLPALTGYVIDSQEATSRFLIDWRRVLTELYSENFFHRMTELAHGKGMKVQYETAGGDVVVMDPMEYHKWADVPMCEFWQPVMEGYVGDLDFKPIRPTASAAHIYGKPRVAAESFTSFNLTWDEHWHMLREVANLNMSEGVTHNVFHTYTHNPQVGFLPPGTSFANNIGTPFLRGQTWWKYMPAFTDFLARTSYLLERGRPVKEILWYLGDVVGHRPHQYTGNGARQTGPYRIPEGFDYDYCNPDVLLHRLSVKDGRLTTPEGISYDVLWIPENERMLPETVEKLAGLIRAGARVIASPPLSPATLEGGEETQRRFEAAVEAVWGPAPKSGTLYALGKGWVAVGMPLEEALKRFRLKPHLCSDDSDLLWSERCVDDARWFFLAAPVGGEYHGDLRLKGPVRFGRKCRIEWWDPVSGSVRAVKARRRGGYWTLRLDLVQAESGFLVLRRDAWEGGKRPALTSAGSLPSPTRGTIAVGNWTVSFPEGWGAPTEPLPLDTLRAWKDLGLGPEGSAFSGTAVYQATFEMPDSLVGKDLMLDLGAVDFIAEVEVNGEEGVLWTPPYHFFFGEKVLPGTHSLTVKVTSTWYNRLSYDATQEEKARKTWTIAGPKAGSPLHDSGLLGPVVIRY